MSASGLKFFCDVMLGRLAKYLRLLGIDTKYSRFTTEALLIKPALAENRIILTRRTNFQKKRGPIPFFFITSNNSKIQLKEVIKHFGIRGSALKPFSRCLLCNTPLQDVDRPLVAGKVPDYIFNTTDRFSQCRSCRRIYWPGTHYNNMMKSILDSSDSKE